MVFDRFTMAEPQCQAVPYVAYLSTHDLKTNASSPSPRIACHESCVGGYPDVTKMFVHMNTMYELVSCMVSCGESLSTSAPFWMSRKFCP